MDFINEDFRFLEKFHLQKIINNGSKIEDNQPINFLSQYDLLEDGQVFEVKIQDS